MSNSHDEDDPVYEQRHYNEFGRFILNCMSILIEKHSNLNEQINSLEPVFQIVTMCLVGDDKNRIKHYIMDQTKDDTGEVVFNPVPTKQNKNRSFQNIIERHQDDLAMDEMDACVLGSRLGYQYNCSVKDIDLSPWDPTSRGFKILLIIMKEAFAKMYPPPISNVGGSKKAKKKPSHTKTSEIHTDLQGNKRVVYTKSGKKYIKKLSKKTNKFYYKAV